MVSEGRQSHQPVRRPVGLDEPGAGIVPILKAMTTNRPRCSATPVRNGTGAATHRFASIYSQLAVMVHWLLVLVFGAHMPVVEPAAVLPMPSRDVPVPRLTIW
jgi:hypothetical protein